MEVSDFAPSPCRAPGAHRPKRPVAAPCPRGLRRPLGGLRVLARGRLPYRLHHRRPVRGPSGRRFHHPVRPARRARDHRGRRGCLPRALGRLPALADHLRAAAARGADHPGFDHRPLDRAVRALRPVPAHLVAGLRLRRYGELHLAAFRRNGPFEPPSRGVHGLPRDLHGRGAIARRHELGRPRRRDARPDGGARRHARPPHRLDRIPAWLGPSRPFGGDGDPRRPVRRRALLRDLRDRDVEGPAVHRRRHLVVRARRRPCGAPRRARRLPFRQRAHEPDHRFLSRLSARHVHAQQRRLRRMRDMPRARGPRPAPSPGPGGGDAQARGHRLRGLHRGLRAGERTGLRCGGHPEGHAQGELRRPAQPDGARGRARRGHVRRGPRLHGPAPPDRALRRGLHAHQRRPRQGRRGLRPGGARGRLLPPLALHARAESARVPGCLGARDLRVLGAREPARALL